ncbi:hypothetical protein MARINOS108_11926 [Marinoscillum sp. 108]|nr:hypothetical protein MARINOS108_11926 [Marinoscillum sp. 108]
MKYRIIVRRNKVIRFSQNPILTICETETLSLASTTVLGPVAAGIIKAQEHATVAGIIIKSGLTLAAMAVLANTGNKILALAVLELNSVKTKTKAITVIKM